MKKVLLGITVLMLSVPLMVFAAGGQEKESEAAASVERSGTYGESPMLAEMVKAGSLPAVDDRLPPQPLVVENVDEVGKYGGTLKEAYIMPGGEFMLMRLLTEPWINLDYDHSTLIPWSIEKWEWQNDEASVIRMDVRKGMRWSDGVAVTADDYLFYINDMLLNKEYLGAPPSWLYAGGNEAKVTKIDDYAFEIDFGASYGMFPFAIANWNARSPYYNGATVVPMHYLKQFHPDYSSKADVDAAVKEGQYNNWAELIASKDNYRNNPDRPSMAAFKVEDGLSGPVQHLTRNPYYWQVDEKGNQLPYIDKWERTLVSDQNGLLIKAFSGDSMFLKLGNAGGSPQYPALMENQEKGNYTVKTFDLPGFNIGCIWVNPTHKDPVKRELLLNLKFRQALSSAINRDEINETLFYGMATPSQVAADAVSPVYGDDPSLYKNFTEYDPALSNKLLDEIGLTKRGSDGFRLGPDGKDLVMVMYTNLEWPSETVKMVEFYKTYFAEVGINLAVKVLKNNILFPKVEAGDYDMFARAFIAGGNIQPSTNHYVFPQSNGWHMGSDWARWLLSNGASGEEPVDAWVKELLPLQSKIMATTDDNARYEMMREAILLHTDNLMPIGVLMWGGIGTPENAISYSNDMGNVQEHPDGLQVSSKMGQWYIK
jgi:peptide/nickel transport system substrate-binding protein